MSEIRSAISLGVYALFYLLCLMYVMIYHPGSPFGDNGVISFGILLITVLVPGGDSSVQL